MSQLWLRSGRTHIMPAHDNKRNKPDHSNSPSSEISNSELAKLIESGNRTTHEKIVVLGDELREELCKGLEAIKIDLAEVNASLVRVKEDVLVNTEAITRSQLINDLVISGVPYLTNEDLQSYFQRWCHVLGYNDASIPLADLRRLTRVQLHDGNNCLILAQFAITNQRNDFFSKYLRSRSLTLAQIGFQSQQRVYVNENLTQSARTIKKQAVALKKDGKLSNVFSKRGVIHVKQPNSDQDHAVGSEAELENLVKRQLSFP